MSAASIMAPPKRVDCWELRCRFNRARELRVDLYKPVVTKRKELDRPPDDPDPLPPNYKFTCEWVCRDANNLKVADGHFYELDDQSRTDYDPKHLCVDGVRYALYQGTGRFYDARRDLTVLFTRHGWLYRTYVRLRRFTCRRWGW
jgi:hypothetical protein